MGDAGDITADGQVSGRARLRAGDAVHPSLTVADDWPAILPPLARLDCPLGGLVAGLGVATASHCF